MSSSAAAEEPQAALPPVAGLTPSRRRVYEEALRLFGERGYHAVSVRDLAEVLGVQPAALYAHARSKRHLLFELVRIGYETHRDWLRDALLDAGREPAEQVKALVTAHVLVHLRYRDLARVVAREFRSLGPDEQQQLMEVQRQSWDLMEAVISRGVKLGAFAAETDIDLAISGTTAMGVRAAEWWVPGRYPSAEYIAEGYANFAVKILS
jgi:AcrR family transcriptional regulator